MSDPNYHDDFVGRFFREVGKKSPRTVKVVRDGLYHVNTEVTQGRGKGKPLQIFRKQLIDTTKWEETEEER